MPPSPPSPHGDAPNSSSLPMDPDAPSAAPSPVLIAGIAAAAAALLALIIWLTWLLLRSKRRRPSIDDDDSARPKLPADWLTAVEQFNRAKSQPTVKKPPTAVLASQFAFPHTPALDDDAASAVSVVGSARATRAHPPPSPLRATDVSKPFLLPQRSRPLSRDELRVVDHHTQTNTVPLPFSKLQPTDVARIQAAVAANQRLSLAAAAANTRKPSLDYPTPVVPSASPPRRKPFSIVSSHRDGSKHHSAASSVASSFSFGPMPYRGSALATLQEDAASPSSPAAPKIQPGMHVVRVAFSPLLPDEVPLEVDERVTVVDVYDDGWCVVLSAGAEVVMGAVPAYCFQEPVGDKPDGFEHTRPGRSTSLGVKVELEDDQEEEQDTSGHSSRHDSTFSWSNF